LALLVDLSDWVRSGKSILSYIAERPQFASRDMDAVQLSKLRGAQPPIFLLNGWNEVPVAGAEAADGALRDLDRSFPAAIVIVATRKHSVVPQLRGSFRLELNPLGRPQRDEYLHLALGESAHDLRVKLNNSRVLDSITRTPLFLAEVVDLYRSGKDIPATKMGVLGDVIHTPALSSPIPDGWRWRRLQDVCSVFDCPHSTPQLAAESHGNLSLG
jgi:hypothetical protein